MRFYVRTFSLVCIGCGAACLKLFGSIPVLEEHAHYLYDEVLLARSCSNSLGVFFLHYLDKTVDGLDVVERATCKVLLNKLHQYLFVSF